MPSHRDRRGSDRARATFLRDQDAGAAQRLAASVTRLRAAHPEMGYHFVWSPFATRLALQQTSDGPRTCCSHLRGLFTGELSGVVVHVRAHEPFHLRCAACAAVAALETVGTAEDSTCDACRRVPPGGVRGGLVQLGPVLVTFGLCRDCHDADQQEAAS